MLTAKNVDEYIEQQKAALVKNSECANTHYNLGMGYLTKRMFKEAKDEFGKALECSPKLVEAYVQLGGIALQDGDLNGCLQYNMLAAKHRPFFAVPWANIGFCYLQKGEADEAIKAFKKAVKQDPKFVQAMANLGAAYFMKGMLDAAINWSNKALAVEPKFGPAFLNLALVYIEQDKQEEAADAVRKAQETGMDIPEKVLEDLKDYL